MKPSSNACWARRAIRISVGCLSHAEELERAVSQINQPALVSEKNQNASASVNRVNISALTPMSCLSFILFSHRLLKIQSREMSMDTFVLSRRCAAAKPGSQFNFTLDGHDTIDHRRIVENVNLSSAPGSVDR